MQMRRSLVIKRLSSWERASEEVLPIDIPSISMVLADPFAVMMAALRQNFFPHGVYLSIHYFASW